MTPQPTLSERILRELERSYFSIQFPDVPAIDGTDEPITAEHIEQVARALVDLANTKGLDGVKEVSHIFSYTCSDHFEHASESTGQPEDEKRV